MGTRVFYPNSVAEFRATEIIVMIKKNPTGNKNITPAAFLVYMSIKYMRPVSEQFP